MGPGVNAGVFGPEGIRGCGAYLGAAELPAGSGGRDGAGGGGVAGLLLGAVELGLEVEDGGRAHALDGPVLLRHHRRLRQPPQRLHPPLLRRALLLLRRRRSLRPCRARGRRRGRCRRRHRGGGRRPRRESGEKDLRPVGKERGGRSASAWAGLLFFGKGPCSLGPIPGPRGNQQQSSFEQARVPSRKKIYIVGPPIR